jgi:REP element-mobilizing transposase RayT
MAQTLVSAFFHVVFSTKNRANMIPPEIESELYAYIGGIAQAFGAKLLAAGGTANHIHLLLSVSKNYLLPDLIGAIKRDSSKWIKTKGKHLAKFGWQDGYSAFSVGHAQLPMIEKYLAGQKEHHRSRQFEDEMSGFYRKCEIDFDERYVWD